jgi:hypothetical protein
MHIGRAFHNLPLRVQAHDIEDAAKGVDKNRSMEREEKLAVSPLKL